MYNELYHYGVKGMKWGVRHDRFKNSIKNKSRRAIDETKAFMNRDSRITPTVKRLSGIAAAGAAGAITIHKIRDSQIVYNGANKVLDMLSERRGVNTPGWRYRNVMRAGTINDGASYAAYLLLGYGVGKATKKTLERNKNDKRTHQ